MQQQKVEKVFIHAFTDGRDSSPTSGIEIIKEIEQKIKQYKVGKIASLCGRYFAMDRNNNWDRTKKAYDVIAKGIGNKIENPQEYMKESYKKNIFDEYLEPAVVCQNNVPIGQIKDGDSVIFFNYREDRARQITKAFTVPSFSKFSVITMPKLFFVTMTQYEKNLPVEIAYPPEKIENCLSKVLSKQKLKQLRIAETEKFAHVTYFFNGGIEEPFSGEDRLIVPSKDVATFDKCPEMSAREITEKVLENIAKNQYDFILINFANSDIVGHTGNEKAAIKAIETVDSCLEKIIKAVLLAEGCLLITADHGNVEKMIDPHTGEKDTEHTNNPVPLWYVTPTNHYEKPNKKVNPKVAGLLSDIAPTVLDIMQIEKPQSMSGESLLSVLK
jgi:2,3-bisphosphoglycerate-independent phosphoglycerate mutase